MERPRSGTLGGGGRKAGFSVAASAWGFSSTVVLGEVDFLDGGSVPQSQASRGLEVPFLPIPSGYPPTEEKKCMRTSPPRWRTGVRHAVGPCSFRETSFPPLSQEMYKQGPCACSGFSLPGRVPACTPHLQGHSTFSTYQVQGGGEPLAAAPDTSPGAHNPGPPSYLVSLSLGPEQPGSLILWETLRSAF